MVQFLHLMLLKKLKFYWPPSLERVTKLTKTNNLDEMLEFARETWYIMQPNVNQEFLNCTDEEAKAFI